MLSSERGSDSQRRNFLSWLIGAWSALVFAPIAKATIEFLTPLRGPEVNREIIRVAEVGDLAVNTAKIYKINRQPVILVHTPSGQFKAFNARCTHLGCVVKYNSTEGGSPYFTCNCHGSEFDINGKNIDGPAPRPLDPFKVILRESSILISKV